MHNLDSRLFTEVRNPYLIQRCTLTSDENGAQLKYDYMGSAELEWGAPKVALNALFETGMVRHEIPVDVAGKEVILNVVTRKGFSLDAYLPCLTALANGTCRLHDPSYLDERIRLLLGTNARPMYGMERINAWFDINNAVFITLLDQAGQLDDALSQLQEIWTPL